MTSGLGSAQNSKDSEKPKPQPPNPTPSGPIEPTPITGAYLTCGWSSYSSRNDKVTILCQAQTDEAELISAERMAAAATSWSVGRAAGSEAEAGVVTEVLPDQAEVTVSMSYQLVASYEVALSSNYKLLGTVSLLSTLPASDPQSALSACVGTSGVAKCFAAPENKVKLYQPGEFIQESTVKIGEQTLPPEAGCGSTPAGGTTTRVRYRADRPAQGQACEAETQTLACEGGKFVLVEGGKFTAKSCTQTRLRYQEESAAKCVSETQQSVCQYGSCGKYSGSYTFSKCEVCRTNPINGRCINLPF